MFRNTTGIHSKQNDNLKKLSNILAASSIEERTKTRMYKEDFKPFTDIFSFKCLTLQIVKATILPANLVMNDFNQQLMESEKENVPMKPFDWHGSFNKHFVTWPENFIKFCTCTFIKKVLEEIALHQCSAKTVDKLTKDTLKSIRRKYEKFGHLEACRKIFATHLWSSAFTSLSLFIYDVVNTTSRHIYDTYHDNKTKLVSSRKRYVQPVKAIYYLVHRVGFYSVSLLFAAVGYSGGSLINYTYGGFVGSMLLQIGAEIGYNLLLPIA